MMPKRMQTDGILCYDSTYGPKLLSATRVLSFPSDLVHIRGDLEHAHLQRQHAILCRQHLHFTPQPWPSALLNMPTSHACNLVCLAQEVFAPQQAGHQHVCTAALRYKEQATVAHCCRSCCAKDVSANRLSPWHRRPAAAQTPWTLPWAPSPPPSARSPPQRPANDPHALSALWSLQLHAARQHAQTLIFDMHALTHTDHLLTPVPARSPHPACPETPHST